MAKLVFFFEKMFVCHRYFVEKQDFRAWCLVVMGKIAIFVSCKSETHTTPTIVIAVGTYFKRVQEFKSLKDVRTRAKRP